eukprot:5890881-Pyramimonas_sp.AAC.2
MSIHRTLRYCRHVKGSPIRITTSGTRLRPCGHYASMRGRCRQTDCGRQGGRPTHEGRHSGESSQGI